MRLKQLACDRPDCPARWPAEAVPVLDRRKARLEGWEGDGEQDLCPDHSSRAAIVERVRQLAGAGLNDSQIGARIGQGRKFVWSVRHRHGISGQRTGRPSTAREVLADAG